MIRDPSDGSVKENTDERRTIHSVNGRRADDPDSAGVVRERRGSEKTGSGEVASGLPLESTKPDRQARLERSREWLRKRREGLVQSTAEFAGPECDHLNTEGAEK